MPAFQKNVLDLIKLLEGNQQLKNAVEISLKKAQEPGIETLRELYHYLESILTHIPNEKELMPSVRKFYFVLSKSPGDILKKDPAFNAWINEFVISRGNFLDSIDSTSTLQTFIDCPDYNIDDYFKG